MRLDATTTATIRPNIHRRMFRSLERNVMRGHDVRLILNVDPVGDKDKTAQDAIDGARRYFPNVLANTPPRANFPLALQWCWRQVATPYFWNAEDDWCYVQKLDLDDMVRVMEKYPSLALLRLPKGETTETTCDVYASTDARRYVWNGNYFEAPPGVRMGYSGAPSLIRASWMRAWVDDLRADLNHERCWKAMARRGDPRAVAWTYGAFAPRDVELTVMDIGRNYRQFYGIQRNSQTNLVCWLDQNGKQL